MLGMDKNTLLKLQIIEILDCLQTPITLKELQMKIGHSSLGTIRMNCKELQGIIYNLYFEDGYSLNLRMNNGRGIQLERSSTNLQSLITYLYKSDLAFVILQKVLAERKLSAIQFCMDQTISESTLRRKIKEINQELAHYHLYISCSAQISLKGREIDIRRFYYIFSRGLHHQFQQIEPVKDSEKYLRLAKEIANSLKILNNPTNIEMISFWLYITQQSLSKKAELSFNDAEKSWFKPYRFPKKPAYLKFFSLNEWKFFLYALYCSHLNHFELEPKDPEQKFYVDYPAKQWMTLFQQYFRPLNSEEQRFVTRKLKQLYVSYQFFKLDDHFLDGVSEKVDLKATRNQYPYYYRRFHAFWEAFVKAVPEYDRRQLRLYSLLTCVALFPLENCLPRISVYAFSELSELFSTFIQEKIDLHFKNRYLLTFVEEPSQAQLIIGTSPSFKAFLSENQESAIIRSKISETDYLEIEAVLERIVKKDLELPPEKSNLS
ncbi:helix-turn-helix domain-containing protein [Enterococcus devriesei]|uniref:Mga helix-turn-helix domain-containing protein n=1 Tax=Enterococcus devriesei TaxID=319970 RepID=A0A1L8SVS3_9ENTE|nr:helix-turn-helix domain-containing protein [Enterococcus devriesei]MBU5365918.1 helix-turn-helix domain-containing protein [Enterococcus devriesei]MDT2822888.1 helix-turn-helix domain-containing protein [Enterococcus devriesei]OJG36046.1 hypothetical protein RV00_GL002190 [Enterococcus devriesei]